MLEPPIRLRSSIISGNLNLTKKLLNRFPHLIEDIDPTNGWTPLHYASYHGHYLIVVFLLSLMSSIDELEGIPRTFKKETPIHLTCYKGHEQVLHLLLQHYPQHLNSRGGDDLMTPLHICAKYDYFKCIELLIGLNVDVNSRDSHNETPLHYSMKYGNLNSIKLLINNNADFTIYSSKRLKPIDMANTFEVEKYFKKLVEFSSQRRSTVSSDNSVPDSSLDNQNVKSPYQHTFSLGDELHTQQQTLFRQHSNSLPPLPTVSTIRKNSLIPMVSSPRSPSGSNKPFRKLPPIHTGNSSSTSLCSQPNERTLPSPRIRTPISSVSYTSLESQNSSRDATPKSATEQRPGPISAMYPNMTSYHLTEREPFISSQPAVQLPSIKSTTSLKQQNISSSSQALHQRRRSSTNERDSNYDMYSIGTPSNRSRSSTITSQQLKKSSSSSSGLHTQPSLPSSSLKRHASGSPNQSHSCNSLTKSRSNSTGSKLSVISRTSTTTSSDSNSSNSNNRVLQNIGRISSPNLQEVETKSAALYRKESYTTLLNSFGVNEDMRQKYTSNTANISEEPPKRDSSSTIRSERVNEHNSRMLARSYSSGGMKSGFGGTGNGNTTNGLGKKILNIKISSLSSRRGNHD